MGKVYFNEWIFEPFYDDPGAEFKRMFGCKALYYYGKLVLVLSESEEDLNWQKVFVPCEREIHIKVMELYPQLEPHSVLGKWLCLSLDHSEFEETVIGVTKNIMRKNPLFGVIPPPKKRKSKKKKASKKKVTESKPSKAKIELKKKASKMKKVKKKIKRGF